MGDSVITPTANQTAIWEAVCTAFKESKQGDDDAPVKPFKVVDSATNRGGAMYMFTCSSLNDTRENQDIWAVHKFNIKHYKCATMPQHTQYGIFAIGNLHTRSTPPHPPTFLIFRYNDTENTYSNIPSYIMYAADRGNNNNPPGLSILQTYENICDSNKTYMYDSDKIT